MSQLGANAANASLPANRLRGAIVAVSPACAVVTEGVSAHAASAIAARIEAWRNQRATM